MVFRTYTKENSMRPVAGIVAFAATAGWVAFPALAAFPTSVNSQITMSDTDHNGKTSKSEWDDHYRSEFSELDRDGNGSISRSEFEAARNGMFDAVDGNHDGEVSAEEAESY